MSLDFPTLAQQLPAAGRSTAQELERIKSLLPAARETLSSLDTMDQQELQLRLQRAGPRWSGAHPLEEKPFSTAAAEELPPSYQVVAAVGSQVYPDRHAAALYFVINIGGIRLQPGSGRAPATSSRPQLFHSPQDLYDESGTLLGSEYINARRDVDEIAELARLASATDSEPCLALMDNSLLLWLMLQVRDQASAWAEELIDAYLEEMDHLKQAKAALAGVIDRPRHGNVLALAHLAQLPLDGIDNDRLQANPYRGLSDSMLFADHLAVGERSAIFGYGTPVNQRFRQAGHEINFFYLRSAEQNLLRVEIPAWVSADPDRVNLVHAGILADSTASAGFPYTLARAHELAVVTASDKKQLDELLALELARQGLTSRQSAKSTMKSWLGGRRSHRL